MIHGLIVAAVMQCGVQRWSVKTLSDPAAPTVNYTPQETTVSKMRTLLVPKGDTKDSPFRYAQERQTFHMPVLFIGVKQENDEDYHIEVADPNDPNATMGVESPDADCAYTHDKAIVQKLWDVHASVKKCFGDPPVNRYKHFKPVAGEVTGVAFFDELHGQSDVAPNGVELHPILSITSVSCPTGYSAGHK